MKKYNFIIILMVICVLASSCSEGIYNNSVINQASDEFNNDDDYDILDKGPVKGGTLKLFTTKPDTLNPLTTKNSYVSDFLGLIYEGLTRLDKDQKAIGVLSDSWSDSDGGLIWNFHIRDGVQWHDGQDLTAYDVEFTINTLLNAGIQSIYKPLVKNILSCAAVDSSNVKIILSKPNSFTPEMMTFPILPKHKFSQPGVLSGSESIEPVGTGPFKYVTQNEDGIALKQNSSWWHLSAGEESEKTIYIDKINVNIYSSKNDAMGALQSGELDIMSIEQSDIGRYKNRSDVVIKKYSSRDYEFLSFNLNNTIISDIAVRKAIAAAINRDEIIEEILPGSATASDIPVLNDCWIFKNSASAVSNKTADEILTEGGWKKNNQGEYSKTINGVKKDLKVEILVNSGNNTRVLAAQKICSQLEKAGIPAVFTEVEWSELINRINSSKYDIVLTGCRVTQIPDLSYLYSASYLPVSLPASNLSIGNISGYSNINVDSCIENMFKLNSDKLRKDSFSQTVQYISEDIPYIGLYFLSNAMIYSKNVRGIFEPYTWNKYNDFTQWYKPEGS
jgi:peptide/nickel transport system substrate-binding protein